MYKIYLKDNIYVGLLVYLYKIKKYYMSNRFLDQFLFEHRVMFSGINKEDIFMIKEVITLKFVLKFLVMSNGKFIYSLNTKVYMERMVCYVA